MQTEFKAAKPDKIEMELTVRMELADWVRLKDQLGDQNYPSWAMKGKIAEMITHAQAHFKPEPSQ